MLTCYALTRVGVVTYGWNVCVCEERETESPWEEGEGGYSGGAVCWCGELRAQCFELLPPLSILNSLKLLHTHTLRERDKE